MPRSRGHKYILVIINKVTNYLTCAPMHFATYEEIGQMLIESIVTRYGCASGMIKDKDSAFMSSFMN